ncbi:TatD family deoxyribonuclease [Marinomonas agarivorans]|nr:TatD family deoxyribonuclease [Marinomonas agarivorans]
MIDSHCHLDFPVFADQLDNVLQVAKEVGVTEFLLPATTYQSWQTIYELTIRYPQIRAAYGIHPYFLAQETLASVDELEQFAATHNAVAIGETGLDFWPDQIHRDTQIHFLEKQLQVAENLRLPVILHARKSYDELYALVKKYRIPSGVVHAFTGSLVQAKRFIDLGFVIGIGGVITYPRAQKTRQLAMSLTNNDFILETDAPDMPLFGYQGQVNMPAQIVKTAEVLADLRSQSIVDVAHHSRNNVLRTFPKWY